MPTPEWLAERFEEHRTHLRTMAYRMLGSTGEADDAVQEAWIRLGRTDVGGVENLRGWLTTVVARVCLDMLRARTSRREDPLDVHVPDPIVTRADRNPESDAMLADSVGLALLVVLETLEPAERLAFVLHDVFGMTFEEIAPIVDRSSAAARQLASRARRRVQSTAPSSDRDLRQQRRVVDAFVAAVREGDFERLVACARSGCRAAGRCRRAGGRVAGRPRRSGRRRTSREVLEARLVQPACPREWQCGVRVATPRRPAVCRDRLHDCERQDCRDEHPGRSKASQPARPAGHRRLSRLPFSPW